MLHCWLFFSRCSSDFDQYDAVAEAPLIKDDIDAKIETTVYSSHLQEAENGSKATQEPLTTKKELWGWYLFEVCSSGFSGSVLPLFLPLLLVAVATDQGWKELRLPTPPACDDKNPVNCIKCSPGDGDRLLNSSGYKSLLPPSA
jgi:hypothetical protein